MLVKLSLSQLNTTCVKQQNENQTLRKEPEK